MGNKKICILTSVHPALDVRIFHKEAKTLVKESYSVSIIAQHKREETVDGVRIVPLPNSEKKFERMTKVAWCLFRSALREKANVYHFHDPELIPVGIILKFFGKKVIYDVHEDYSKQILNKKWVGINCVRKFVAFIFNIIEQLGASLFNGIVAATPDIAKKFNPSKTVLVRNLSIVSQIDNVKPLKIKKQKPIIVYVGGLTQIRGIKELIQAIEIVKDKAELRLLGKWESEEFEKECESLEGWQYTKYIGFVPLDEVYKYIKGADIGVSILYPAKNYITSLPIKAFEYMACSLPMVMSNFPYWQETFGECALFANPFEPKNIAGKVLYFLDNPDEAKQRGKKGRQLVEEKYNWELESKKLLTAYSHILQS